VRQVTEAFSGDLQPGFEHGRLCQTVNGTALVLLLLTPLAGNQHVTQSVEAPDNASGRVENVLHMPQLSKGFPEPRVLPSSVTTREVRGVPEIPQQEPEGMQRKSGDVHSGTGGAAAGERELQIGGGSALGAESILRGSHSFGVNVLSLWAPSENLSGSVDVDSIHEL
jgi:hypothetical protein